MAERFVRIGVEIPLSLYSNLDKIKNGSAASNRILEAVKKEKDYIDNSKFARLDTYEESVYTKCYCRSDIYSVMDKIKTDSVYGEMKENKNNCYNCKYCNDSYGHYRCFAQKNAPKVDYNHTCENFIYKENNNEDQETT